jgi:hypothetical protein
MVHEIDVAYIDAEDVHRRLVDILYVGSGIIISSLGFANQATVGCMELKSFVTAVFERIRSTIHRYLQHAPTHVNKCVDVMF